MFKKLKDKIAEEVKQSPSKISATVSQFAQAVVSPSSSSIIDPSFTNDNQFSISEDVEETPRNTPTKSGFTSVDLRESQASHVPGGRSRRSSTNSVLSDASLIFPSYDYSNSSFHLQSDLESASELDDSVSTNLTSTSKEQLASYLRKSQYRYNKYKGRWHEVIKLCKELERENTKAKVILTESQDKALRRIAELKEQCLLEKQAKAHLEEILRNDLEEKDHLIMTLNTKIDLLKLGESGVACETSGDIISAAESLVDLSSDLISPVIPHESEDLMKEKVKKLETLLVKCKDAIKIHKEKVKEFSVENDSLKKELANTENTHLQQLHRLDSELSAARGQITLLQQQEEESALSLAEAKRTIHSEMETKEEQINRLRDNIHAVHVEKDALAEKCNHLQNQLAELQNTQQLEITSDNEKQMQELSRVKQEAVKLLQAESSKNINDLQESWSAKMQEVKAQLKDAIQVNKQLEAQCIALEDQTVVLEGQKSSAMEQVASLEKQNADLQDLTREMETKYVTLNEELHILKTENISLQDGGKLLESQVVALKDQTTSLESHVLALLKKYSTEASSVDNNLNIQQKIDFVLSNVESHSLLVIESLQSKVNQLTKEKDEMEQFQIKLNESVRQLREDIETKDVIICSHCTTIDELHTSQTHLKVANNELTERLRYLDDANTHLSDVKANTNENELALQSELNSLKQLYDGELARVRNQLESALTNCEEHKATIDTLKASIVASKLLEEQLIEKQAKEARELLESQNTNTFLKEELQAKLAEVTRNLDDANNLFREEKKKCNAKDNQLRKTIVSLQDRINQSTQLQAESERKEAVLSELQKEVNHLENQITTLNIENKELNSRAQTVVDEKEQILISCEVLKQDIGQLTYEKESLGKMVDQMAAGMESLTKNNLEHQAEVTKLHEEFVTNANLNRENNDEIISGLTSQVESLTEEVLQLKRDNMELSNTLSVEQSAVSIKAEQLKMYDQEFAIERERSDVFTKEVNHLTLKNEQLRCELDEAISAKDTEESDKFAALQEKINQLLAAQEQKDENIGELEQENEQLKSTKDTEESDKFAALQEKINQLLAAQEQKDKNIGELKRENEQLQADSDIVMSAKVIEANEKFVVQQQLNDALIALQLKEKEFQDLEEKHVGNVSQLAKDFQNTLKNKEEELIKAHEEEKTGMEHSEGIQLKQLRDQVKAMKSEAHEREEMMDSLRDAHNAAIKALEQDLASTEVRIADAQTTHQSELREADRKWRQCLDREIEQRDASHHEEVQALSDEWQLERKDPITEVSPAKELASTSQVAVAAVESGTGSIELMQRQLMGLTKELKEAKRCHKLEVSQLRQLMAMQGSEGPTEFEYLRNILFEYMMGRECTVLTRVIAAVLKFDNEQTIKVIKKLEHQQTLLGQLGII